MNAILKFVAVLPIKNCLRVKNGCVRSASEVNLPHLVLPRILIILFEEIQVGIIKLVVEISAV